LRIATGVLVAVVAACGSRANPQPTSHPTTTSTVAAGPEAPTDRECEQLIAHAVELRVGELRATKPSQVPTDADQDAARHDIAASLGADCRRISRATYACAVAAKTTTELVGCDH
jgi:hypothetical protein